MSELGLSSGTVSKWFKLLGDPTQEGASPDKLIYIENWLRPPRGDYVAVWKWGPGMPDMPKPKPMTQRQYDLRHKQLKQGFRPPIEISRMTHE